MRRKSIIYLIPTRVIRSRLSASWALVADGTNLKSPGCRLLERVSPLLLMLIRLTDVLLVGNGRRVATARGPHAPPATGTATIA